MKLIRVVTVAFMAALVVVPAMATTIRDDLNPASEHDLWRIYETLGFGDVVGDDSNNITQISPDDLFTLLLGDFVAVAYFAGNSQVFGYYTPGTPGTEVPLLTVGPADDPDGDGYVNVSSGLVYFGGTVGFYLTTRGYMANTWYSESFLNGVGGDHMIALATGDPDVILLAWEDLPLFGMRPEDPNQDSDYNDLVVVLTRVIPEPTSMALLGMGIAGMAVRAIRRKRAA